ncbi:MAG: hypothetical protein R3B48_18510 [Kofleriaceae bacterium]
MNLLGWYGSCLAKGPSIFSEIPDTWYEVFEAECHTPPERMDAGEITLAGHANLFATFGRVDLVGQFRERLYSVSTDRDGPFAQWYHAKALAGIALGEKGLYRRQVGAPVPTLEPVPFTPGELHGYNPQSLLAHLAGAAENHASITDVWPAFEECVFNFPTTEATGTFDGACLFWIARIVHHHIGGQPLGETAAWLSRHFNAWADGQSLPPLGVLTSV